MGRGIDQEEERRLGLLARAGDAAARSRLIEENVGLVYWVVRRIPTRSPEDAEDLQSHGMLGLIQAVDHFDPDRGNFTTWAIRLIRNRVQDARRRVHSVRALEEPDSMVFDRPDPLAPDLHGLAEDGELADLIRRALALLTPDEQQVIRLRYGFDGEKLSGPACALRLGISRMAAYRLELSAICKLRDPHNTLDLWLWMAN